MSTGTIQQLYNRIATEKDIYFELAKSIWENPEVGMEEHYAVERQVKLLKEWGFEVEVPYLGLETAYRAEWGRGDHSFAFAAEYDALPEIGHACGHNLICTAALAAANSLKKHLEENGLEGRIIVLGTPAEEETSGKAILKRSGCMEGVDAVMMTHPSGSNTTDSGCSAREHGYVEFFGKSAHAGGSPHKGVNALDAMNLFFNGVACWRQHIPEHARIHGVIERGGERANMIPDYTKASFYVRSTEEEEMPGMLERFHKIAEGASLMTGCTYKVDFLPNGTNARRPNSVMNGRYKAGMEALGQTVTVPERPSRGSSDFGNFSVAVPGIHPYFKISTDPIVAHSIEYAQAANTDYARENMLRAAAAMADIGLAFLGDADFRGRVKAEFKE